MSDLISRRAAIDALWEALYEYEDKTKKQFQESDELDVEDWIEHRSFVQNMSDIDRQTILNLPSAQPEPCDDPRADVYYLAEKIGIHQLYALVVELRGEPAQPERKKGNWVYGEDEYGIDGYHCDKCGFFVRWDYAHNFINYIEDYNFCPSCGADMRGEEDG